jgi:membrane protein YqaA with SNARE-associated domain
LDFLSLFVSAFLAATILPFSSEIVLLVLLKQGGDPTFLWLIATLGNTLGAVVNWFLGRGLLTFQGRRWFYFSPQQIYKAQFWFDRIGKWSLLLAWVPIIGDGLTLVAGVMRVRLAFFILLVGLGKGLRYAALVMFWQGVIG